MAEKNPYSVHPTVAIMRKWIVSLPEKTGRSLDEWADICHTLSPKSGQSLWQALAEKYPLSNADAKSIVASATGTEIWGSDPKEYLKTALHYVDEMYGGKKEHLRPLHEKLLKTALATGPEAKACPCQTIVPIYRNHVFAQIKPTTNSRIDIGFALKDMKPTGRLIDTGGFAKKDRITHRIPISSIDEIDAEVKKWLKLAYDMDAKK